MKSQIDLQEMKAIASNSFGWTFIVVRISDRWIGGALGKGKNGEPNFLNVFHEVAEGFQLGVKDRALAIRQTCAVALDPEQCFGGIEHWLIPEAERGTLADLPPEETDEYGYDGDEYP
jgi:hypothetical protein